MQPRLIFSHANGFPAGVYRILFEQWRLAGYQVETIERLGHDPAFPVDTSWRHMRDHLLALMADGGPRPVFLVGHSLGGMLSFMAASHAPQQVQGVVMLDSPVIAGWRAQSVRLFKHTGWIGRFSPGQVSQRRRQTWPDRAAVLAHFASKPAFARWDPRVLADYVTSGFDEVGSEVHLGFRREIETRIYNTLPHHLGALLRAKPSFPVGFIAGTESQEMRQAGTAASRRLAGDRYLTLPGSHLYPMERPAQTAAAVLGLLASMPSRTPQGHLI